MTAADLLLVRVDAGPEVGTGHAMRCLALAQGWRDGHGDVAFAHAEILPAVEDWLRKEGFESIPLPVRAGSPEDAKATATLARDRGAAWTVLDGYRFGGDFQKALKAAGTRLLAIDDYGHAGEYTADLVLDQNAGADASLYTKTRAETRLLLGPRYVLLQRGHRSRQPRDAEAPEIARRILVTFGGIDARDLSSRVLHGLEATGLGPLEVRIVVGLGNPHAAQLEAAARASPLRVQLERSPADLVDLMAWADLAVAAAGTTSWELAHLGVPSVLLATADNQRRVAENLAAEGAALDLGWHADATEHRIAEAVRALATDPARRREMTRRGEALVDGDGISRVVTELKAALVVLRPVTAEDARLLWGWANDPLVRSVSFSTDPIPWDRHVAWLKERLADPATVFFLASGPRSEPFGQIRFNVRGEEAEVSVSLDTKSRGRGYGGALILAGSRKLFASSRVRTLQAYVKDGNEPSVRAFLKAGYSRNGRATVRGHDAIRLTLRREDIP